MQKVSKSWWRSEALYLASAAGLVVLIVFLSLGIHACIGNEQGNKADGMDESPSATHTQIRATRLAAGSLILCDKAHPFSEDEVEELEQDCVSLSLFAFGASDPPLYALEKSNIRLQKEAAISLAALAQALAAEGYTPRLLLGQGYLPYDGVGKSPFHTGYLISLSFLVANEGSTRTIPLSKAEDDPDTRSAALWLMAKCARYGFILGDEENTLRYVGHPHASYMESNQLSLADYLAKLKGYTATAPLTYSILGKNYTIYYKEADHGAAVFALPVTPFSLSGDGNAGFVICYIN